MLYRAVGAAVVRSRVDLDDEAACAAVARGLDLARLADPLLRTRAAGETASRVAVHSGVRQVLLDVQRSFAAQEPGAVLDGRDIGTVVVTQAPAKLFVTASPEVRARRRWRQLRGLGDTVSSDEILADIRRRDARDGQRVIAPMRPAADATLLDTTDLDIDRAFDAARRIVEAARARWEQS